MGAPLPILCGSGFSFKMNNLNQHKRGAIRIIVIMFSLSFLFIAFLSVLVIVIILCFSSHGIYSCDYSSYDASFCYNMVTELPRNVLDGVVDTPGRLGPSLGWACWGGGGGGRSSPPKS